jgi:hypothetical protein
MLADITTCCRSGTGWPDRGLSAWTVRSIRGDGPDRQSAASSSENRSAEGTSVLCIPIRRDGSFLRIGGTESSIPLWKWKDQNILGLDRSTQITQKPQNPFGDGICSSAAVFPASQSGLTANTSLLRPGAWSDDPGLGRINSCSVRIASGRISWRAS